MSNTLVPLPCKLQLYALVTGADGMPIVDDLDTMPREVWDQLTEEQRAHLLRVHNRTSKEG